MPNISIYFDKEINISAQIGDIAYYTPTEDSSNFKVNSSSSTRIGKIKNISYDNATEEYELVIDATVEVASNPPNTTTDFIFFSKDNTVNSSSVLGYYSEVKFENNSNEEKSELFSVGFEVTESSK
jgi:hypothetical protein